MKPIILFLLVATWSAFGAQPGTQQSATGSLSGTATGALCALTSPYATFYTIVVDGETGTGIGTVSINTFSTGAGTYEPITSPAWNALSVTASTLFLEFINGPMLGLQVSVTAHTSGTITATIIAN